VIARIVSFCAVLALAATVPGAAIGAPRPVAAEDLFKFTFVTGPQISPDGARVVYVATRLDGPKETYDSNLYLVPTAGGVPKQLGSTGRDSDPVWSPDSRTIVFTRGPAKKGMRPQLFAYDVASGRLQQLTHLKGGASGAVFSHDGRRIAFRVVSIDPAPPARIDFAAAGFKPKKDQTKSDVRVVAQMHFEANGAGYVYDRHPHIWVMNADGSGARALTSGVWSEGNPRWSPDDRRIAFDSLRYQSPSLGPNDIYTIPAGGGAMRKLVSNQPYNGLLNYDRGGELWFFSGGVRDPAEFAALIRSRPDGSARKTIVPLNAIDFGDAVLADMGEPGGFCGPYFAPHESFVLMNAEEPGYSALVKLDARTGSVQKLTTSGEAADCSMDQSGRFAAYTLSDFTHPREVYVIDLATGRSTPLTGMNDAILAQLRLSTPQPFSIVDDAGFSVHAWFMPAIRSASDLSKAPTILDIHGGPQTQFGETFFHELQFWAGQGYNVVFSDPRGSVGFGYPFEEALAKHWGAAMFDDVQRVMDAAVKRPDVDPNRLGVAGGSYGGYATLWVVGHTHRYKAAIAERAVSNLATEQLAADLASDNVLGGRYAWGLPWQAGNLYMQQSPISSVAYAVTPLLILHSEEDIRTPIDQTLQWFNAEKILGRTIEYVVVPGENHDLSRTGSPIHRVERLHILARWFGRYLHP